MTTTAGTADSNIRGARAFYRDPGERHMMSALSRRSAAAKAKEIRMTPTRIVSALAFVGFGFALGTWNASTVAHAQGGKVFELRTYTAPEGKLPNLQTRFRDHTIRIFNKHGMKSVG